MDSLTAGTAKPGHFPGIKRWAVQSPGNVGGFHVGLISVEGVQAQTASPSHGVPGTQPSQSVSHKPLWATEVDHTSQDQFLTQYAPCCDGDLCADLSP